MRTILLFLGKGAAAGFFVMTTLIAWGLTYQTVPPFRRVVDRFDAWDNRRRRLKRMRGHRRTQQTDSGSIDDINESLDRYGPFIGWSVFAYCAWQLLRVIGG